jgi:hypothetical protein
MGKKYTSNGKNLRVVCIDRENTFGYKVVGVFDDGDIKCFRSNGDSALDSKYDLQEVWEPTENEWCWFWDCNDSQHIILSKFKEKNADGMFGSVDGYFWIYCAKFTGELPEHLQEKTIDFKKTFVAREARCQDCTYLLELDGEGYCNSVNDIVKNIIDCPYGRSEIHNC